MSSPSTQLMSRQQILTLYKQLLTHAKHFPSIRRTAIYTGIQQDFRANAHMTQTAQLRTELARALDGLTQLQQYTQLGQQRGSVWAVDLSKTQPKGAGQFKPSDHVADAAVITDDPSINQQAKSVNAGQQLPEWLQKHKQRKDAM